MLQTALPPPRRRSCRPPARGVVILGVLPRRPLVCSDPRRHRRGRRRCQRRPNRRVRDGVIYKQVPTRSVEIWQNYVRPFIARLCTLAYGRRSKPVAAATRARDRPSARPSQGMHRGHLERIVPDRPQPPAVACTAHGWVEAKWIMLLPATFRPAKLRRP